MVNPDEVLWGLFLKRKEEEASESFLCVCKCKRKEMRNRRGRENRPPHINVKTCPLLAFSPYLYVWPHKNTVS